MNLAIGFKNDDRMIKFILDCVVIGKDYIGSNSKVINLNLKKCRIKWTHEVVKKQGGTWGKTFDEIKPCPEFKGSACGSIQDVNNVIKKKIRKLYTPESELKMIRCKAAGIESDFSKYNKFVEKLRKEAKKFKKEHFNADS